jgi:hypothetical protein
LAPEAFGYSSLIEFVSINFFSTAADSERDGHRDDPQAGGHRSQPSHEVLRSQQVTRSFGRHNLPRFVISDSFC